MTWLKWFTLFGLSACAPSISDLPNALTAADSGQIWFKTAGERSIVLDGNLLFPTGSGPFRLIILMHACGGLYDVDGKSPATNVTGWQSILNNWGYATFVVDSFGGRRLREVCTDPFLLDVSDTIRDAYGALTLLSTHPKVDRTRVALMGFSWGGVATLRAATAWAKQMYAPSPAMAFRAFLPFYPYCNTIFPEMSKISAPVRIHIGELDDLTPAATCVALAKSLREGGFDIETTVYRGALHAFDRIGQPVLYFRLAYNPANCHPRRASITGPILNLAEMKECVRTGATMGWSPTATHEAQEIVRAQLEDLLK